MKFDLVLKIDADNQYDPRDLNKFVNLMSKPYKFCKGTRFTNINEKKNPFNQINWKYCFDLYLRINCRNEI